MARTAEFSLSQDEYTKAAQILSAQRETRGETQLAAAIRFGTSPDIISNIERRTGKRPSRVVHAILQSAGQAQLTA